MPTGTPYEVLGVLPTASAEDIRSAYRDLAKRTHPDLNPDDLEAEERFKAVQAAYDLIADPAKRARYDRGEIDETGAERPERQFYRGFAEGPAHGKYASTGGFDDTADIEDFLAGMFGGSQGGAHAFRARGHDASYVLQVDFLAAAGGSRQTVTMPDGRRLNVAIPSGVRDRQTLRLKGQGLPGMAGGEPGDAYVEIHVRPHAFFVRKNGNIHMVLPVSLAEAVLGGPVEVPTVSGPVSLTIPKGSNTGTTLRLKERGILDQKSKTRGDQYVELKVVLPPNVDEELADFVAAWAPKHPYDPRRGLDGGGS